ncbi:MAG: hypothetical protein VKL59_13470 [Nostocaceae cyanobacterium]|nr:hypothetical protein [Nostocaceae cyanobacterium]
MGEQPNNSGQFFTPLIMILAAMVKVIYPFRGETVDDCGLGTDGFLA